MYGICTTGYPSESRLHTEEKKTYHKKEVAVEGLRKHSDVASFCQLSVVEYGLKQA